MTKVFSGEARKKQLLEIGARLAAKLGAVNVQRQAVAKQAKCAPSLVSAYFGPTADAQKAFKREMKKLGLSEPPKAEIEATGMELRMHKERSLRDTRKRSAKEVDAIKKKIAATGAKVISLKPAKVAAKKSPTVADVLIKNPRKPGKTSAAKKSAKSSASRSAPETKPAQPPATKPTRAPSVKPALPPSQPAEAPPERKTAARSPIAPPPGVESDVAPAPRGLFATL